MIDNPPIKLHGSAWVLYIIEEKYEASLQNSFQSYETFEHKMFY